MSVLLFLMPEREPQSAEPGAKSCSCVLFRPGVLWFAGWTIPIEREGKSPSGNPCCCFVARLASALPARKEDGVEGEALAPALLEIYRAESQGDGEEGVTSR